MRFAIPIWILVAGICQAQIKSEPAYRPHDPIVLHVQDEAKPGQKVNAVWRIDQPAQSVKVGPSTVHVWAPPSDKPYQVLALVWVTQTVNVDGVEGDLLIGPPRDYATSFRVVADAPPVPPPGPGPEPEPEPEPQPTPDVPDDQFDNLGQRVAKWAEGLPNRLEVASTYRVTAKLLRTDPQQTVNTAAAYLTDQQSKIPSIEQYNELKRNTSADLQQRWGNAPLSKGVLADWMDAVATGLEAGQ